MARLLVVDDDPSILALIRVLLAAHEVHTALSGEECVETFAANGPFHAVICDLALPGIQGMEVIRRIRQIEPGARVLVMTGLDLQDKLISSLRENVVDFIRKPFDADELLAAVSAVLASEQDIEVVSAMSSWIELRVPASYQVVARLGKFFEHLHAQIDQFTRDSISTAFRELLNNAIEHGCEGDKARKVTICYLRLSNVILYRISDPGRGFSRHNIPHAAVSNPSDDPFHHLEIRQERGLRPGGFGILCIQGIADELIYNEQGNEVVFARYLDGRRKAPEGEKTKVSSEK